MPQQYGGYEVDIVGVAATTGGAILGLANPEGVDLIIDRVIIDCMPRATGAANLNVGIAATATTSSATLIAANAGAGGGGNGVVDSLAPPLPAQKWPVGQFLTISGSASTVGLIGRVYLEYRLAKP